MNRARLVVTSAGPSVTLQDAGRFGRLRYGVTEAGPMDRFAHAVANLAVGNDARATAIEVSPGGLTLECRSGDLLVAVVGGGFVVEHHRGARTDIHDEWTAVLMKAGDRLTVRPGAWGSWAYVSVAGELDAATWLDSTSTHSASGFGGGVLTDGQVLEIARFRADPERTGGIPMPAFARPTGDVRVVLGPQTQHFRAEAGEAFTGSPYALTTAFDRMGVRLDGPALPLRDVLSIPSEPIVRGSVQVAGDGVATVLLADHQTTGGYPKIATVVNADVDSFAQLRAGDHVRFEPVDASVAIEIARARRRIADEHLALVAGPGRTLTHRLRSTNLITEAAVSAPDERI